MLSRKLIRRLSIATAISLSVISFRPIKSEANPAALAAPAACATGVGCILVGTAVVGGVLVYIWQNRNTGQRYQVPASSGYDANQFAGKKKPKPGYGQMGLDGTVIDTPEGCRSRGGNRRWIGDVDRYGMHNGKPLGKCYPSHNIPR